MTKWFAAVRVFRLDFPHFIFVVSHLSCAAMPLRSHPVLRRTQSDVTELT